MPAPTEQTDGAATVTPTDFFESIGKKAGHLAPATNGANGTNGVHEDNVDDEKIVEEIESLCMNCHENVSNSLRAQFDPMSY